jgi:methionine-gamma-lyase
MLAFDIRGGEREAFQVLNAFKLIKLAVSLGSTESLAQHPASMTHAGIAPERRVQMGITEKMIRLSVGIENVEDLIGDLDRSLARVQVSAENAQLEQV